jgi:hypothetical protein
MVFVFHTQSVEFLGLRTTRSRGLCKHPEEYKHGIKEHTHTHIYIYIYIYVPRLEFEISTLIYERTKIFHTLHRAATVTGF